MRFPWSKIQSYRYYSLENGTVQQAADAKNSWGRVFLRIFIGVSAISVAFALGRQWPRANVGDPLHLQMVSRVFQYNEEFGEPPSAITDAAWDGLFPEQGGFFKHPTLAPERSAFSVFHQLHCLKGIREGYWVLHGAVMEGKQMKDGDFTMMTSPEHIRHCIDLLRQSLMCNPDLTVELKNSELGGVTGFGTMHQCQSWDQLMRWTATWQTYNQDPRNVTTHTHMHHEYQSD